MVWQTRRRAGGPDKGGRDRDAGASQPYGDGEKIIYKVDDILFLMKDAAAK